MLKTVDELCSLPGMGPKMAPLGTCRSSHVLIPPVIVPALMTIWDRNVGIGMDVHVHHIANRLK